MVSGLSLVNSNPIWCSPHLLTISARHTQCHRHPHAAFLRFEFQFIGLHLSQIQLTATHHILMHLLAVMSTAFEPVGNRSLIQFKSYRSGLHRTPVRNNSVTLLKIYSSLLIPYSAVPRHSLNVFPQQLQQYRFCFWLWMWILPAPTFPLARHASFGRFFSFVINSSFYFEPFFD
jgi:hypothetical protein